MLGWIQSNLVNLYYLLQCSSCKSISISWFRAKNFNLSCISITAGAGVFSETVLRLCSRGDNNIVETQRYGYYKALFVIQTNVEKNYVSVIFEKACGSDANTEFYVFVLR